MILAAGKRFYFTLVLILLFFVCVFSASCSRRLGYGILLWSSGDPAIPSGTILPVYIRSNIDRVWVVGIPDVFRSKGSKINKLEIPLSKLELAGNRLKAKRRAKEFAPYALSYAENLQDGLPIREGPDNGSKRVYRLRQGEIIKILSPAKGNPAIGASGDPLPGEWFKVLTETGTTGYCFSYRLLLFEHEGGILTSAARDAVEDPELDRLLSKRWFAETYGNMINSGRINLEELSQGWGFDPGLDSGIAHISLREEVKNFSYTAIRPTGTRSWQFEGAPLQMNLRSDTMLAVQFTEANGLLRTVLFVTLPAGIDDLVIQERARREELFNIIYSNGPVYTSYNYGTITFQEGGRFTWSGYDELIPQIIPASALGSGYVDMCLYLSDSLASRYTGAFSLMFNGLNLSKSDVNFLYIMNSQEFRLEYIPDTGRDGIVVSRRANIPLTLNFFRSEQRSFVIPGAQEAFPLSRDSENPGSSAEENSEFDFFNFLNYPEEINLPGWDDL